MKIGVFSGTFDPVHAGHLAFARQCLREGIDEVIFMPEPEPRRKEGVTSLNLRLKMINLAIKNESKMESFVPPDHKNHTPAETREILLQHYGSDNEYWLLVGGDVFEHVPRWKSKGTKSLRDLQFIKNFKFLVGLRTEDDGEAAVATKDKLGLNAKLVVSDSPSTASSKIRRALERGESAGGELDPEVQKFINQNGLYGTAQRKRST